MAKKGSKEYSTVFLLEDENVKLQNLCLTSSLSRCSAANSVGTWLEFAAFGSGPDAKYSRAREGPFGFFFRPLSWFLWRSQHIIPGKTLACLS